MAQLLIKPSLTQIKKDLKQKEIENNNSIKLRKNNLNLNNAFINFEEGNNQNTNKEEMEKNNQKIYKE